MTTIKRKQWPEIDRLVRKAFPANRKQSAHVWTCDRVRINSAWDGGSRDQFALLSLTGQRLDLPPHAGAVQFGGTAPEITLGPDEILVSAGIFNGKPGVPFVRGSETALRARAPELFTD